jgi:hypothetical protein
MSYIIENSVKGLQINSPLLCPKTVAALESLIKASEYKSYCKIEKTKVKILDRGCGHWEAFAVQTFEE